jgi:predicted RNA-binding Zn-ribbon protein involved in translation (DUF1610 family)
MSLPIVRCPYCVLGGEFRPMFRRAKKYICLGCGHHTLPGALYSKCACPKCQEMNQIATRCRNVFEGMPHRANPATAGK